MLPAADYARGILMSQVAIVTESSSNLPPELVKRYDITVLPLRINWKGQSLRDGIDITSLEFYARLETDDEGPKTTAITPVELGDAVRALAQKADAVVAILLSRHLSGSVEVAQTVQRMEPSLPL